jgi:hypothetical protein
LYRLRRGWSCAQIASNKGIKESTADNYVGDAIRAGRAYRFGALGVPRETLDAVRRAVEIHRDNIAEAACAAAAEPPAVAGDLGGAGVGGGGGVGAVDPIAVNAITTAATNATATTAATTTAPAAAAAAGTYRATVRAVRELLAPGGGAGGNGEVPYSHVSFALAHLERLEMLAVAEAVNAP